SLIAKQQQFIVPIANRKEAALAPQVTVFGAAHLLDVVAHLNGVKTITTVPENLEDEEPRAESQETKAASLDLSDIKGQSYAKHALEIAAAGEHNILLVGPPGTGKTMLASRFVNLLPDLPDEQALQSAALNSLGQDGVNLDTWRARPFRSPHHSASAAAIVGGGSKALPGEISLAHNGVLFLDELTEFDRKVLESMREPLESGEVSISRATHRNVYPSKFILVAAMNPCKDGFYGDRQFPDRCSCTPAQIQQYRSKISGPMLDRIDMHIEVPRVSQAILSAPADKEPCTASIKARVVRARAVQIKRQSCLNSELPVKQIESVCTLDEATNKVLNNAIERLGLSGRAYHRILKLARTIADLANAENIQQTHVMQAIQLRSFDRVL
ncbi:MAG: magnesium chelatase family protein, partial [Gammaproteobacteria bacterium]